MNNKIPIAYELFELKPAYPKKPCPDYPVCYEAMVITKEFEDLMPNFNVITTQGTSVMGENSSDYPRYANNWLDVEVPAKKLSPEIVKKTIEDWLGAAYMVSIVDTKCSGHM